MDKFLVVILMFIVTPVAYSSSEDIEYYFAIKGGVSLGSYESGVNWALLRTIEESDQSYLKSFSGASAGSLNSVLSVVDYCTASEGNENQLIDNIMRKSWDVGLPEMLKHDLKEKAEVSLLTRKPIRDEAIKLIKDRLKLKSKPCEFVISMSVTMMKPHLHELKKTGETIPFQRFVVPIKVDGTSGQVKFYNYTPSEFLMSDKPFDVVPGPYLKLAQKTPNDQSEEISFDKIVKLAFASSAFPVAFQPIPLHYCFANELKSNELCTHSRSRVALFSDGGMFDNSPVGVGLDLIRDEFDAKEKLSIKGNKVEHPYRRLIFINPDHYRAFNKPIETNPNNVQNEAPNAYPGLVDYGSYLFKSFDTATAEIYKDALIAFERERAMNAKLFITTRHHNLLADFHAHFGALYSPDFRMHDYLVGVYDGKYLEFRLKCQKHQFPLQCREIKMSSWINSLSKNETAEEGLGKPGDKRLSSSIEFLQYLYITEFKYKPEDFEIGDNIYIALAESFPKSSRYELKKEGLGFADYLRKLFVNIQSVSAPDDKTNEIVKSYRSWLSDKFDLAFENLLLMQENAGSEESENTANDTLASLLRTGEPLINSHMTYYKTGIWPLAFSALIYPNVISHSFRYGFDISEKSQELEFATRFRIYRRWSLDANLTFNRFGGELDDDHYWDIAVGPTYHFSALGIHTVSVGFEYTGNGKQIYDDNLHGVHISAGLLYEILNFKVARRTSGFNPEYSNRTRESTTFAITFDITKIGDIAGIDNLFRK